MRQEGQKEQTHGKDTCHDKESPDRHLLSLKMHENSGNHRSLDRRHNHPDNDIHAPRAKIYVGKSYRDSGEDEQAYTNLDVGPQMSRDVGCLGSLIMGAVVVV